MELVSSPQRLILALVIGMCILVYMVLKTKIHTFIAMILTCIIIGVIGAIPFSNMTDSIAKGFGNTLGNIGIIIGLGVMMGAVFEASGAAKTMAGTFLKIFGKGKEDISMLLTGFLVSIPIFCDAGFVILAPLAKSLSKATKKSIILISGALAGGLVITHTLVPPTPGPVGVAGIFGINLGSFILWGIVVSIPMAIAMLIYFRKIQYKLYQLPADEDSEEQWVRPNEIIKTVEEISAYNDENLPGVVMSFAPIVIPIILILLNNVSNVILKDNNSRLIEVINFLGTPVIAVLIGTLVAIFGLTKNMDKNQTLNFMEEGIKDVGTILLVTGAGGALGAVMSDSGLGNYIANILANFNIPPVILPIIISTMMRFIQGSGTVSMITAASITAPVLSGLDVNMIAAALGCCVGGIFFGFYNDSFFNVVTRTIGIKEAKEQIKVWSIPTTIAWAVGVVMVILIDLFI
ncbi:gluconate:H+ symporter [Anaerococcus sp. AGMB09787]|uniref:GntP family permease n=1 Tax=Anaerococcus sp. AGMB09787 TaxID=2922869 RepID=UPI00243433E0|nr:gluconate:H+ symporter [Anaerococcus sp. AGMB09787]